MAKRGRPKKGFKFDDLPEPLRYGIINVMAKYQIKDFEEAYRFAGQLLDMNSKEFDDRVNKEAERRHRSRFLTQLNKARSTIDTAGYNRGFSEGYRKGTKDREIHFYCDICGETIIALPDSDSHRAIIRYMKEHRWAHAACQQKR